MVITDPSESPLDLTGFCPDIGYIVRTTLSNINGLYQVQILPLRPVIPLNFTGFEKQSTAAFFTATETILLRLLRQLKRFHHLIHGDKVFGTHTSAPFAVNARTISRPMPEAPAVTRTRWTMYCSDCLIAFRI
jgi:hypothetical protein